MLFGLKHTNYVSFEGFFTVIYVKQISFQLDVRWEMVACGKTQDQIELTEQAHKYLNQTALQPRSLNL